MRSNIHQVVVKQKQYEKLLETHGLVFGLFDCQKALIVFDSAANQNKTQARNALVDSLADTLSIAVKQ